MIIKNLTALATILGLTVLSACDETKVASESKIVQETKQDIDQFCSLVERKYAYFKDRSTYWAKTCELAKQDAQNVQTKNQILPIFETLIDELYDPHANLGRNSNTSPWLMPSGAAMRVEMDGPNARIVSVRQGGAADIQGIRAGMLITKINSKTPKQAALERIRAGRDTVSPQRAKWAINAAVTGYRNQNRHIVIATDSGEKQYDLGGAKPPNASELISWEKIDGDIGYIKFNNSLGNSNTVEAFDTAMESLKSSKGWIIDLRDTPSGGNTSVAEPIIGRFITKTSPYQKTVPTNRASYDRLVKPRGPWTADEPIAVLVGAWTGSMGEGMAIGFDGMRRGRVIGNKMAGLAGGTEGFTLKNSQIPVWFPTYSLAHLDGTPRHEWVPKYNVNSDQGGSEDLALETAVTFLSSQGN